MRKPRIELLKRRSVLQRMGHRIAHAQPINDIDDMYDEVVTNVWARRVCEEFPIQIRLCQDSSVNITIIPFLTCQ